MKLHRVLIFFVILLVILGGFIFWQRKSSFVSSQQTNSIQDINNKKYRKGADKVLVFDVQNKNELGAIDLSAKEEGFTIAFVPHDIEIMPSKKFLFVTATANEEQLQAISKALIEKEKRDYHVLMATDQVIVIDPTSDKIVKRIQIGVGLGLADIIIAPDNKSSFVAAETGNAIYKINLYSYKIELIQLPFESRPHQLALSTDGTKLYARNQTSSNMFLISTITNEVKNQDSTEETKSLSWSSH